MYKTQPLKKEPARGMHPFMHSLLATWAENSETPPRQETKSAPAQKKIMQQPKETKNRKAGGTPRQEKQRCLGRRVKRYFTPQTYAPTHTATK